MDHFKDFNGFLPKGRYVTFHREEPVQSLRRILTEYKGITVTIDYDMVTEQGIQPQTDEIAIPHEDSAIYNILADITTDCIRIDFYDEDPDDDRFISYTIQKIVIADQFVSQIDRDY